MGSPRGRRCCEYRSSPCGEAGEPRSIQARRAAPRPDQRGLCKKLEPWRHELTLTMDDPCSGIANLCPCASHLGETVKSPAWQRFPVGSSRGRHLGRAGTTVKPGVEPAPCWGALPRWCPRPASGPRSGSSPWSRSCILGNLPRCLPDNEGNGNAVSGTETRPQIF